MLTSYFDEGIENVTKRGGKILFLEIPLLSHFLSVLLYVIYWRKLKYLHEVCNFYRRSGSV